MAYKTKTPIIYSTLLVLYHEKTLINSKYNHISYSNTLKIDHPTKRKIKHFYFSWK